MKTNKLHIHNESGSITIIASIMVLLIITLVGISAMDSTTVELQIASNDQRSRIAFYNADSGAHGIPKIISRIIDTSDPVVIGDPVDPDSIADGVVWDGTTDQDIFYDQVLGYDDHDPMPDVIMGQGGFDAQVDVQRIRSMVLAGGGAEFASGVEGIGVGTTGGVAVFYELDSRGRSTRGANANVVADYRKVVGVAGGL
jgi:type IV pilus assembly PilX-like protein